METRSFIDTHILIWMWAGELEKISSAALKRIENSILLVSPIVVMEIDYLFEIGRLNHSGNFLVQDFLNKSGASIPDTPYLKIIQASSKLNWTRDVFDRLLVAHATITHDFFITKDEKIRTYYPKSVW